MALTQKDLDAIKELIEITIDEKFDKRLGLESNQTLDNKFSYLLTRDEFYEQTDKLMKELKDMREELTVTTGRVSIHSDEIEALQKIHPDNKHLSTV